MLTMVGLLHNSGGLSLRRCLPAVTPKFVLSFSFLCLSKFVPSVSQNLPSLSFSEALSKFVLPHLPPTRSLEIPVSGNWQRISEKWIPNIWLQIFVLCELRSSTEKQAMWQISQLWHFYRRMVERIMMMMMRMMTMKMKMKMLDCCDLFKPFLPDAALAGGQAFQVHQEEQSAMAISQYRWFFLAPMEYGHDVMLVILW